MHLTRGDSRDQRPDLNQVLLDVMVAQQAGIPVLMQSLSGHRSDAHDFGHVITDDRAQVQLTDGLTFLGAASALSSH